MYSFLKNIGKYKGKFLAPLPQPFKRIICRITRQLIKVTRGKLSSLFYIIGERMVKHMYFGKNQKNILTKRFPDGFTMRLDVAKKMQRIFYLQKIYEPYVSNYIRNTLKEGDVFIDIGANVGIYTLLAARITGTQGRVYAFEPEEENFRTLRENVKRNNLHTVLCVQKALSNTEGTMTFYVNPLNDGGGGLVHSGTYYDDKKAWSKKQIQKRFPDVELTKKVAVVSFDAFAKEHNLTNVFLIKIDVEGGELLVLEGMQDMLEQKCAPRIICEVSEKGEQIRALVEKHGYAVYTLDENGNTYPHTSALRGKNFLFSKITS